MITHRSPEMGTANTASVLAFVSNEAYAEGTTSPTQGRNVNTALHPLSRVP